MILNFELLKISENRHKNYDTDTRFACRAIA